jgi:hypothetical protein
MSDPNAVATTATHAVEQLNVDRAKALDLLESFCERF